MEKEKQERVDQPIGNRKSSNRRRVHCIPFHLAKISVYIPELRSGNANHLFGAYFTILHSTPYEHGRDRQTGTSL